MTDTPTPHDETVEEIFETLAALAPEIRASLPGRRVKSSEVNPSGETRLEADAHADELLEEALGALDGVGIYASEEQESPIDVGDGPLSVAVDPLDGSSNIASNSPVGTIVAVYEGDLPGDGDSLVASAFVLFGPILTMVSAYQETVTESVVETGERDVIKPDLSLPESPTVYGIGGNHAEWTKGFSRFVQELEERLKLRYGGSMAADINQVLTYGGIFSYPALTTAPKGKLRLQFEGIPMAYIIESAGGASSDGSQSILDVKATEFHQRVPVYLGNTELVNEARSFLDFYE
jgi:fructose-1,6-bisphosphatase I